MLLLLLLSDVERERHLIGLVLLLLLLVVVTGGQEESDIERPSRVQGARMDSCCCVCSKQRNPWIMLSVCLVSFPCRAIHQKACRETDQIDQCVGANSASVESRWLADNAGNLQALICLHRTQYAAV